MTVMGLTRAHGTGSNPAPMIPLLILRPGGSPVFNPSNLCH